MWQEQQAAVQACIRSDLGVNELLLAVNALKQTVEFIAAATATPLVAQQTDVVQPADGKFARLRLDMAHDSHCLYSKVEWPSCCRFIMLLMRLIAMQHVWHPRKIQNCAQSCVSMHDTLEMSAVMSAHL